VTTSAIERPRTFTRYAAAIFLSSALLFLIEPIAAKRILPLLGGSAAVWAACLVFFQCALLLGYFTAHWLVTRASDRAQVTAYLALLLLSLIQLIIAPRLAGSTAHPIATVLWLLAISIGIPFVTLSATSPLLQAWYARTEGSSRPYRLYSVSNIGSMLALVIYPWLIEPRLSVLEQMTALVGGFILLGIVCAAIAFSGRHSAMPMERVTSWTDTMERSTRPVDRVLWVALAACGSLLLSAITNHISQNVATIPLLWIAPLIAYLLSFVVAFAGERWRPRPLMIALGAMGLGAAAYLVYKGILSIPIRRAAAIFCASLFGMCLFLHSELYRLRPAARELTSFYFHVAAGGAIGAILVGVVAPSVLPGNYELAFGFACVGILGLVVTWSIGRLAQSISICTTVVMIGIIVGQVRNDRRNNVLRIRNFYGTLHVTEAEDGVLAAMERTLYNGVISHGQQIFRADLSETPTTYYGRKSGVGFAIDMCCTGRRRRIGVIGLGAGTIAAYGQPGDTIRFYDINPAVEGIARSKFRYLRDSPAKVDVVIGDARVSLANEPPQRYDVIAVDAFSGDAIPVHLIDAEALAVYKRHLAPGGIVAFHVSNRYLNLKPVVAQIAGREGMKVAYISNDGDDPADVWSSDWVLVTANEHFLNDSTIVAATSAIDSIPRLRLWTDDYNSLLPIWRQGR
jgi:SAM-dependent methyltransferase